MPLTREELCARLVRDPTRSGACAALAAGCAMLRSFAPVAPRWRHEFAVIAGIGIGVHSGEVAMGSLGPPGRRVITLIGDTANVVVPELAVQNRFAVVASAVALMQHRKNDARKEGGCGHKRERTTLQKNNVPMMPTVGAIKEGGIVFVNNLFSAWNRSVRLISGKSRAVSYPWNTVFASIQWVCGAVGTSTHIHGCAFAAK
jgi:hypothetical protein